MLLIGSRAIIKNLPSEITPWYKGDVYADYDYISTTEQWDAFKQAFINIGTEVTNLEIHTEGVSAFRVNDFGYYEAYVITKGDGSSGDKLLAMHNAYDNFETADINTCLAIKTAHRYKKNTPFFLKTMAHIKWLRQKGAVITPELEEIVKLRQKESLSYAHPKLNVSKESFFDDTIYTYDHDSIHKTVALAGEPAYTHYIKDNEQVLTSKEKFFSVDDSIRLAGVYEETCVLALERSQIPNDFSIDPERSFRIALEKVCTSITSGWFREYAYENYAKVIMLYNHLGKDDYVKRFKENFHMVRPFKNNG